MNKINPFMWDEQIRTETAPGNLSHGNPRIADVSPIMTYYGLKFLHDNHTTHFAIDARQGADIK